jgi:hypothetical protein
MNGFAQHGLNEEAFGEKDDNFSAIRTFDAFREWPVAVLDSSNPHSIANHRSQNQADLHPTQHRRRLRNTLSRHLFSITGVVGAAVVVGGGRSATVLGGKGR